MAEQFSRYHLVNTLHAGNAPLHDRFTPLSGTIVLYMVKIKQCIIMSIQEAVWLILLPSAQPGP